MKCDNQYIEILLPYIKRNILYEYTHVPFGIGIVPAYPAATDFF